jgi:hypothetical protein
LAQAFTELQTARTLIHTVTAFHLRGDSVKQSQQVNSCLQSVNVRAAHRRNVGLPARLTWKDQRGATRFASVVARNVSEFGVFVECQSPVMIPLYRLVQFQFEREVRESDGLPESLHHGRILSAVYRIQRAVPGARAHGLALRLMVDPRRAAATARSAEETRATA